MIIGEVDIDIMSEDFAKLLVLAVENHLLGCYDPEDCTNDIERAEMLGEITGINLMVDEMLRRIKQAKEEETE